MTHIAGARDGLEPGLGAIELYSADDDKQYHNGAEYNSGKVKHATPRRLRPCFQTAEAAYTIFQVAKSRIVGRDRSIAASGPGSLSLLISNILPQGRTALAARGVTARTDRRDKSLIRYPQARS